jgi:hypothetical protein
MKDSDKTWLASYHLTDVAALWYGHLRGKVGPAAILVRVSKTHL